MNAYNHIIASTSATRSSATRNRHGISLPFIPGISEVEAEPQQVRKVTVLPATIRKVMQPKDAPAPERKPHTFYTKRRKGEPFEMWIARDWKHRVDAEGHGKYSSAYSRDHSAASSAGKKSALARIESDGYIERRAVIIAAIGTGEATSNDVMHKINYKSKDALRSLLRSMVKEGRLVSERVGSEYLYWVADHG